MLNTFQLWRAWVWSREPLWCYWRTPWATGERQGSLFSEQGISLGELAPCEQEGDNLKTTCKQVWDHLSYWTVLSWPFHPKASLQVFSRIADLHDLITACYFELPALISPNSTAIPKYCSGFKFNSFCLNDEWAIQFSKPGECSYFFRSSISQ